VWKWRLYDIDIRAQGLLLQGCQQMMTTLLPIRALTTKSNGWHDISVMARVWYGEGNVYSREQKLSFNGKSYRTSTQRSVEKLAGEVVIPATEEGTPLY
jgi:hypothetical protein